MKKYLKRIVILFALLLSIVANAYDFEVNSIYYNSNGSNATVTHQGPPHTSNSYSGNVVIPEEVLFDSVLYTVSAIDEVAFWFCNNLKSVDIPNTVTTIGSAAFWGCTNLSCIKIPKSVISIPATIGVSSSSLENPFAVESIKSIQVENGNPKYDSRNNCNAIIETETNTLISGCQNSVIPNSVTIIGGSSFCYSHFLKNIEIPNSVTTIGIDAFRECYGLTHLVIPNSVITIWDRAFYDCKNLKSVEIPTSVTKFDGYLTSLPFYMCNNISTIMISGEGEWVAGRIPISMSTSYTQLYIDSHITSVKNMDARPAEVYCYASNPPDAEGAFYYYTGTLHVPQASLAAYFTAPYWSNFSNIVGDAVEPSDVILNHESIEINSGEELTLTAQILPENAFPNDITWTSTNPNVVDVHDGILSAISPGECDIIARCLYKKAICHVIVNDTTVTITLDQHENMLLPNHMLTLIPSATPFLPEIVVTSSDPSIAAARVVNDRVQVVGIKEGTTTITVGSIDGNAIPATCLVTVYTECGDVNMDGFVTINDVTQIIDYLLSGDDTNIKLENADVNGNGNVSIGDVTALIDKLLSGN